MTRLLAITPARSVPAGTPMRDGIAVDDVTLPGEPAADLEACPARAKSARLPAAPARIAP
jgi:hypothetical protein